ncbi:zinc metalloprotease [Fibrella aquatilis]|uniref:Zinc metalloprotease n=1 Tax=Fibrella aquatilis TaxID=2817059 RepID=A0A939GAA1_9BACT|nr:zinc metalloprotease [Fibrella aquatilis]MBO0932673.1 zinc metalloprotease [Fibrella aquatilis]
MKKFTVYALIAGLICSASACLDSSVSEPTATNMPNGGREEAPTRQCASMDVLGKQLKENPGLQRKMDDIEAHTNRLGLLLKTDPSALSTGPLVGTLTIPIAIHVIYNSSTPQENISDAQIQSQITVLNRDYSKTNTDISKVPTAFASLASNMQFQFRIASIDRKASAMTTWGTSDAMKKTSYGGVAPVSPTTTLNIWICNIGSGILGYAQFPGGAAATDGVVISPKYFGSSSLAAGYYGAPFDKGRTATHEIGHWLNLRHIWGDASCGNDLVADTPTQSTSNFGCPSFPRRTCGNTTNGDMFMNYMDYTDDLCMFMFSEGQKTRSRAIFSPGGPRASFAP